MTASQPEISASSRISPVIVLAVAILPLLIAYNDRDAIGISLALALLAGFGTSAIIPELARFMISAGLTGKDMNKADQRVLYGFIFLHFTIHRAESLGVAAGAVYLVALFIFLPFPFLSWFKTGEFSLQVFPFQRLGEYTSALLSICCMLLLGFADDVLNLKWRHKLLLPAIATLPVLMIYAVTSGVTYVMVPWPFRTLLGHLVELGPLYYVYMTMVAIFCTNSINILAGINGLEVGQSVVIAISVLINDIVCVANDRSADRHMFSFFIILPFLAVSVALLRRNWYPAQVFIGDTYCYFAGMTFGVAGILGHYSKTLLLFFIPQIINFLYSCPQLFGFVPCPRHRMPRFDEKTGLLYPSLVTFESDKIKPLMQMFLRGLALVKLLHYEEIVSKHRSNGAMTKSIRVNNMTLLNLILIICGPMREDHLTISVLFTQAVFNSLGFVMRYPIARFLFAF